jgi:hypothetical protein
MPVSPLPLTTVPAQFYDTGTVLYPNPARDLSLVSGRKLYLDGSSGTRYFTFNTGTNAVELWANGAAKILVNSSGNVNIPAITTITASSIAPAGYLFRSQATLTANSGTMINSSAVITATGSGTGTIYNNYNSLTFGATTAITTAYNAFFSTSGTVGTITSFGGVYSSATVGDTLTVTNFANLTLSTIINQFGYVGSSLRNQNCTLQIAAGSGLGTDAYGASELTYIYLNATTRACYGRYTDIYTQAGGVFNATYGTTTGTTIFNGGESLATALGLYSYVNIQKAVNANLPAGEVAAIKGQYNTSGIALTSTFAISTARYRAAICGTVAGNANSIPHAAILAYAEETTTPLAVTIPAAFKAVSVRSLAGGGFNYGLDLVLEAGLTRGIITADIRGHSGNTLKNTTANIWESDVTLKSKGSIRNLVSKVFINSPYLALATDNTILWDATGGACICTLPAAASHTGRVLTIKKVDATANAIAVTPNGAEKIDGAAPYNLGAQWESIQIQSDGSNWYILAKR